jgi:hypothetical protein
MYLALCGCLFVLLIADGAALWHGFLIPGLLSAYLAVCSSPHLKIFMLKILILLKSPSASLFSGSVSSSCAGEA